MRAACDAPGVRSSNEVENASLCTISRAARPRIRYRHQGGAHELEVRFHCGMRRIPWRVPALDTRSLTLTTFERTYPFGWLGILAEAAPGARRIGVFMDGARVCSFFSMRFSPTITRLYLQCDPEEDIAQWPDERIWNELNTRLTTRDGWKPNMGPILQKGVTGMRSFVVEPMRFGRLFLAGDAAHIVPPTGAKGLNLAAADVYVLAQALARFYESGSADLLDAYSDTCLRRVWRAQRFSWWMTSMLHLFRNENAFDRRRQLAELDYLTSSRAAMTSLAENYVGFPIC